MDIKYTRVPDNNYKVWLDTSLKSIRMSKPNKEILQIFKDTWHPILDKEYICKCINQSLAVSNWTDRLVYYVTTIDKKGNVTEGFIPLPKYIPEAFKTSKTSNPRIHFLYKVSNEGLFYFK